MLVRGSRHLHWDQVQMRVPDAALGGQRVRETAHRAGWTAQHRHFQTSVMVQMHVQTGDRQIMMIVVRLGQPARQVAGGVVVHIAQRGDAGRFGIVGALPVQHVPHDVAQRLGSAGVAAPRHQPIDGVQQIVVDRNGDALHEILSLPGGAPLAGNPGARQWCMMSGDIGMTNVRVTAGGGTRRRLPPLVLLLLAANVAAWICAWRAFAGHPTLLGTALLAWSFGLRHAVDADHIAAIDNVVRKLMQEGERPIAVGFFFSLGHSTIVILAALAIAATTAAMQDQLATFKAIGGLVGTLVSAVFLLLIAIINLMILRNVWRSFRHVAAGHALPADGADALTEGGGILARLCRPLFRAVTRSWHMFPVGFLFGLGFDTATEVGLLGIAATQAAQGMSPWLTLIFPALFTAGMALVDTADSIFMVGAYGWAFVQPLRKLWYNMTITAVSVVVALFIGGVEALGLCVDQLGLAGGIWSVVSALNDDLTNFGFAVVGIFVLAWGLSALVYRWNGYDRLATVPMRGE